MSHIWKQVNHRLDHICPEYGQPGTINLYGPEYDQPGISLCLLSECGQPVFVWEGNPEGNPGNNFIPFIRMVF